MGSVLAHGFGVRYDLPAPLAVYLAAAAGVVVVSFILVAFFVRGGGGEVSYPRLRIDNRPLIGPLVRGPGPRLVGGTIGVITLLAIVVTGYLGAREATYNPAEYLLWIYGWPLLVILSSAVGNLWSLVNPWAAIYDAAARLAGRREFKPWRRLPEGIGIWSAVLGYLAFAYFELVSGQSANPGAVASAVTVYTLYTLGMMVLFGREWLDRGEPITVLYRFVGAFGPVEVEDEGGERRVYLRPWAMGLTRLQVVGWDVIAFVVLMLASLAFDGLESTPLWAAIYNDLGGARDALGAVGPPLVKLGGLVSATLIFGFVYLVFVRLVVIFGGARGGLLPPATLFAFTLVPIALVYFAAHFYAYVVIQSQGLIPLFADPLHRGANLLPTAGYRPSFDLADVRIVWYLQVSLIVIGHMIAVYLAHLRALVAFPDHRAAQRSQLPMLVLMVLYTCTSIWILAQPNVEAG
jgi:hypothetical protein